MRLEKSGYNRIDHPIPPLFDKDSRVLILGSFPSVKSREAAFFYGHPRNRFWKTMAGVLSSKEPSTIAEKKEFLHQNHVALWDVIASCEIVGSSDSSIRNVVANDLSEILNAADIQQIFCNGAKSYEYYCRYIEPSIGREARRLPSTSPANAAFSLDRLKMEWQVICEPLKAAPAGIGEVLLDWYDYNARLLPWRSDPSPYHVWISEVMLQQTRVEAVRGYYDRWMEELPDVESLALVSEERLLKLWEGLGYYNRARNLKTAAISIMSSYGGELPADYGELLALKGIGEYTAGAIASIAFGLPEPAVDGNVLRVFSRLLGEEGEISRVSVKRSIRREVSRVMPRSRPGDFNQALMDLGSGVCLPGGIPDCENCPWENVCVAHRRGKESDFPVRKAKKTRRVEKRAVFVIVSESGDSVVLHKRPSGGLLPDLWEFPNVRWKETPVDDTSPVAQGGAESGGEKTGSSIIKAREIAASWGLTEYYLEEIGEKKHIFSHVEWQMSGYLLRVKDVPEDLRAQESWVVVPVERAEKEYAIPSAFEYYKKWLGHEVYRLENEDKMQ